MKRKRILISPNSFKECADSVTIAETMKYYLSVTNDAELLVRPISDGGDGFLKVCKFYFGGEIRNYKISTAYEGSSFECPVLYCYERREIYIESAEVLGLKVIPKYFRNPLKLSSKGLGELVIKINEEIEQKKISVNKVFIGIGGTATIDMGMGMMSELGLTLYNSSNIHLNVIPENYLSVSKLEYTPIKLPFEIIPIVDVDNLLMGNDSGIMIYGKQKGADEMMISLLIKGFNHLLNLLKNNNLVYITQSLSGAGGGIPVAIQLFYDSSVIKSKDFLVSNLGFAYHLNKVDYLITGEGAYDIQTGFGKGAGILIKLFYSNIEKIFLVCGGISKESREELPEQIYPVELQSFFKSPEESIANYTLGLKLACEKIKDELNF